MSMMNECRERKRERERERGLSTPARARAFRLFFFCPVFVDVSVGRGAMSSAAAASGRSALSVLMTGGGSGIGKGVAMWLAGKGHHVWVTDLDAGAARATADAIGSAGGSAEGRALDVTDDDAVGSLVRELPKLDAVINNAGMQHVERLEDFPPEKWRKLVDLMLCGPAVLTARCLPRFREQNFGRIINLGSIHSVVASPYKSAYVSAKHGIVGLTKTVALETADADITINTVCPSYVLTPLVEKQINDTARVRNLAPEEVVKQVMLKPMYVFVCTLTYDNAIVKHAKPRA